MKLPKQVRPVIRTDIIQPDTVLNLANAPDAKARLRLVLELLGGANYNDPMSFSAPVDFCGCHVLFRTSAANCRAFCLR